MIKLNNDFYIESDENQFILKHKRTSVKKETQEKYESEVVDGYYVNLPQALKGYINSRLLQKTATDTMELKDVKKLLEELKEEISKY